MAFRDLSLRRKMVVMGIAASACALMLTSVVFLITTYIMVQRSVRADVAAQARIIADNSTAALAFGDRAAATETLDALRAKANLDVACLYDASGQLFAQFGDKPLHTCPAAAPADGMQRLTDAVTVAEPVVIGSRRMGTVYLRANLDDLWFRMRLQATVVLAGFVLGVLIAALIASRLERIVTSPLRSLASTAARISDGSDYTLRAPKQSEDEIGSVVDAFNSMVEQVERRDRRLSATNEELSHASRLKDEFLAALSHELRTPLNAILGWLQILRSAPGGPAQTSRALDSLERNARVQARLIEDLLDVSRIVSGKLHFQAETVELTAVVQSAVEAIRPAAATKHIEIAVSLTGSPSLVTGDADRLRQAVWNLLSNAVKFSPAESRVDVSLAGAGGLVLLTVRDHGIGIDPAFLPHVFERFRQADGSVTRQHGGLGLGLAIAREIIQLHGGVVRAASDGPGHGATFSIELPALTVGMGDDSSKPRQTPFHSLSGVMVLVVDDDEDSRELACQALLRAGAEVVVATGGIEALAAIEARRFDALVCDMAMPGQHGYEVLRLIRERESTAGRFTPAIALTAHAGDDARRGAEAAGFQAFLSKPFEFSDLVAAVAQLCHVGVAQVRGISGERTDGPEADLRPED